MQALHGTLAEDFDVLTIQDFYAPIFHRLKRILQAAFNLFKLTIVTTNITPEFLQITGGISTLHTLSFSRCDGFAGVATLVAQFEIGHGLYRSFQRFQHMAYLSSVPSASDFVGPRDTPRPSTTIRERCNPFMTLERVYLDQFGSDDISTLSAWMFETSGNIVNPGLRLTHFKLHTRWGVQQFLTC
jgi:hypothetical protein